MGFGDIRIAARDLLGTHIYINIKLRKDKS